MTALTAFEQDVLADVPESCQVDGTVVLPDVADPRSENYQRLTPKRIIGTPPAGVHGPGGLRGPPGPLAGLGRFGFGKGLVGKKRGDDNSAAPDNLCMTKVWDNHLGWPADPSRPSLFGRAWRLAATPDVKHDEPLT